MKILFIVNPVAGKRKSPTRLISSIKKIVEESGFEYSVRVWKSPEDLDEMIQLAISEKFNRIVAVGGDGTVNAIGKRLIGTEIAMGIVPSGSGNGYAHHLGFSKKYESAIRENLAGGIVKVDTGIFGGIPFLNSAGIGIDAEVAGKFAHSKRRGLRTYIQKSSQTLMHFRSFPVTVEVDGVKESFEKVFFVDIANGTEWGNGAKISPLSRITDGSFTSVIVPKTSFTKFPKMLNQLFRGSLNKNRNVRMITGKKFILERLESGIAHVDGDPVMLGQRIECEIIPFSLSVVVPHLNRAI